VNDVLAGGTGDAPRASGRRRALVGLVLVLTLLAVAADRWQAARERGQLLRSVTAGEQAVEGSQVSIASLARYSSDLLHSADVSDPVRRSAYQLLADDAGRWRPRVQRARSDVAATAVLPWHGQSRAAREAYEQRLTAWLDVLADFEAAPQAGLGGAGPAVTTSRGAARQALLAAGLDRDRVRELLD
jgi:hypothetical protein